MNNSGLGALSCCQDGAGGNCQFKTQTGETGAEEKKGTEMPVLLSGCCHWSTLWCTISFTASVAQCESAVPPEMCHTWNYRASDDGFLIQRSIYSCGNHRNTSPFHCSSVLLLLLVRDSTSKLNLV